MLAFENGVTDLTIEDELDAGPGVETNSWKSVASDKGSEGAVWCNKIGELVRDEGGWGSETKTGFDKKEGEEEEEEEENVVGIDWESFLALAVVLVVILAEGTGDKGVFVWSWGWEWVICWSCMNISALALLVGLLGSTLTGISPRGNADGEDEIESTGVGPIELEMEFGLVLVVVVALGELVLVFVWGIFSAWSKSNSTEWGCLSPAAADRMPSGGFDDSSSRLVDWDVGVEIVWFIVAIEAVDRRDRGIDVDLGSVNVSESGADDAAAAADV